MSYLKVVPTIMAQTTPQTMN